MDLERTFTFRNSKQTYSGIPIIVANMDTVGTFEMAVVMSQVGRWAFCPVLLTLDELSEAYPGLVQTEGRGEGSFHEAKLFSTESDYCQRHFFSSLLFNQKR